MAEPRRRDGYALLAVLWICTGVGALSFMIATAARDAVATSRNRVALTRAAWIAQGCVAQVRTALHHLLSDQPERWNEVDRILTTTPPRHPHCMLEVRAVGARLDVNAAPDSLLARLFASLGLAAAAAESAAAAVADWRDPDDDPRPLGAERAWYAARGRRGPSNRLFVHAREIRRVRGLDALAALDTVLDVEPGPIVLSQAAAPVLALLPGFTPHTVEEVVDARRRGTPIGSFLALSALLSPDAPEAAARLPGIVVLTPTEWLLTVRSTAGRPAVTAVLEARIGRGSATTALARRRSWVE